MTHFQIRYNYYKLQNQTISIIYLSILILISQLPILFKNYFPYIFDHRPNAHLLSPIFHQSNLYGLFCYNFYLGMCEFVQILVIGQVCFCLVCQVRVQIYKFGNKMSSLEIRVCGRYRLEQKIYEGHNASVYIGKNVQSDSDCAIKCQSKNVPLSLVMNEGKVLQNLQGGIGIPHLVWFGQNGDFRFLVTELLGNNLEQYLDICGGKFSLKTTLMIADKILSSIEFIHYKNYVHRDIKPGNFVMGLGKKLHQVYTVDLAYATTYLDPKTRQHRTNTIDDTHFVGTLKFASLNVHRGHRNSRRDDLESVGLMMIYFLKGKLPWCGVGGQSLKQKRRNIRKSIQQTTLSKLCQQLPKQLEQYMQYVRSLKYDDIPDYNYLRRMLKQRFIKEGFQFDYIYDWILIPLKLKDTNLSNRIPLNRFTKKQDTSLSMCNSQHDFTADFMINQVKIQDKKEVPSREEQAQSRTRRAMSNTEPKKTQQSTNGATSSKPKSKGSKQDCSIF